MPVADISLAPDIDHSVDERRDVVCDQDLLREAGEEEQQDLGLQVRPRSRGKLREERRRSPLSGLGLGSSSSGQISVVERARAKC